MQSVIMNMLYWNLFMNLTDSTTIKDLYMEEKRTSEQNTDFQGHALSTDGDDLAFDTTTPSFGSRPTPKRVESVSRNYVRREPKQNSMITKQISTISPFISEAFKKKVCYPIYGEMVCFSLEDPWSADISRPIVEIPSDPEHIETTFHMFTRDSTSSQILDPDNIEALKNVTFGINQNFKIIAHGFRSSVRVLWVKSMIDELLRAEDDVVIAIDWHKGAIVSYAQAAANVRVVGVQTAHLIHKLITNHSIPLDSFHLIGHSMGSHLMGHCGHYLKSIHSIIIPRITALDPAGPLYKDTHPSTRLNPSDADFVDVIHTDNDSIFGFPLTLGMIAPIGHLDFYPNGGIAQPKCSYGSVACQHYRAIQLFTESIRQSCTFIGIVCESYELFLKGNCWGCEDGNNCFAMGMKAVPLSGKPAITKLFLRTYGHSPYCGTHYRITVRTRNETYTEGHEGEFAVIGIELNGLRDTTGEILLSEKSIFYTAGTEHKKVVLTNHVGNIKFIVVSFHYPESIFNPMSWRIKSPVLHLHSIVVEELYPSHKWNFCFVEPYLTPYLKYKLTAEHKCADYKL